MNYIDKNFYNVINEIKSKDVYDIYFHILEKFKNISETTQRSMERFFAKYSYWGELRIDEGYFKVLFNKAEVFKKYLDEYAVLYESLKDYKSKYVLFSIVNDFYNFDFVNLKNATEYCFKHYFDLNLMPKLKENVFVDVGAYVGDTVLDYVESFGEKGYKKIYCYEICQENIDKMKINLKKFDNIEIRRKAVSDKKEKLRFDLDNDISSNHISTDGKIEVEGVSLDEDIKEKISMVKMDIEGSEMKALAGMKEHIKNDMPILLISVYHNNTDLVEIPKYIRSLNENYDYYLRYYGGCVYATEIVLFALPKTKKVLVKNLI